MILWKFHSDGTFSSLGNFDPDDERFEKYLNIDNASLPIGDEINFFGIFEEEDDDSFMVCIVLDKIMRFVIVENFPALLKFTLIGSEVIKSLSYTEGWIGEVDD